ncbi:transcriptional repressor TCF25-domain-containing protein [Russula earlei]|uniref:Transcriptional repressor TCF25-domain-containing protein n=1 Tax=Russula earlei TaxID=71964 RepID=A0ACC0UM26_9AGAM|nr:transcriptional repressor TCF25-domain-containing protein [Russula earlei]
MPARLSKRQQRELEELTHVDEIEKADKYFGGEEARFASVRNQSAFAALLNEDDGSSEGDLASEGPTTLLKAKKKPRKKKKKGNSAPTDGVSPVREGVQEGNKLTESHTTIAKAGPDPVIQPPSSSPSSASKKEWKALKKQKSKAKREEIDDFDRALDEVSMKYRDTSLAGPATLKGNDLPSRSLQDECFKLLSVSLSHLNPDAEMRRFFGAKVISTSRNEPGSSSRARQQPTTQRSNLTRPRSNWGQAKLREGLTLRPLTNDEAAAKVSLAPWENSEEKYWTAEYSKKYKGATRAFMQTVLSGDPEGFYAILRHLPWHADTILQLAELFSHREEHSQAADFIERALFTYERAFVGAFTFTNGLNRLNFDRVENRPFFLALHRQVIDLQRRGIYRTAFEFARLLLSLDPWSDPHGACFHLDFLAIKSGMHSWLLSFSDIFSSVVSKTPYPSRELEEPRSDCFPVRALPGWAYARALAFRAEGDSHDSQSTEALRQAVLEFPSVVPLLVDKAEIALSAEITSHPAFRIFTQHGNNDSVEESLLHLLSRMYAQRSHALWKDPIKSSWFAETVTGLVRTGQLPPKATATAGFARLQNLVHRSEEFALSVYRHVVVLGSSAQSLLPFIPAHVINNNSLACDPLPPRYAKSQYNDEFFRGAEDAFADSSYLHRSAAQTQRVLERLIPDPVFRRQLQDFFAAHPRLREQFPGGVVQFAQLAGHLPEDVLQDIMVHAQILEEAVAQGLPGDNFVQLDFVAEADVEVEDPRAVGVGEGTPDVDEAPPILEEDEGDEEEDEGFEEIAPLPIRVLRNLVGRFWGGFNAEEEGSSENGSQRESDLDGVD